MKYVGIIIIASLLIWFLPLLFIWSINTLFGLGIGYTFKTWLASLLLTGVLTGKGLRFHGNK